ncbi:MAG: cupin-like domain-containing protein [Actinobacteria bacterium]|nr:cupin-like domain-containing protein [Actinomycetota bacterium]
MRTAPIQPTQPKPTATTPTPTTRTLRSALARCVEPVEESTFLAEHWERKPLVVERDEPGRFDDLLTTEDVEGLLESGGLRSPAFRLVRADVKLRASDYLVDVPWRPVPFKGVADVAHVAEAFDSGTTLVVQGLHHWWPALATFCRSLEASLGHPAQANAYYTPRSAQGLPVHHDTHDVFCLQIAGEKRWLVYDPVWELPLKHQRYDAKLGAPGEPALDVTLQPGDTLYLPRGWLHEAKTSDSDSLHLTIGVNVYSWLDAFKAALEECADHPGFRRSPDGSAEELLARLRERLGEHDVRRRMRSKLVRTRRPVLEGQIGHLRALRDLDLETELERRSTVLADLAVGNDRAELTFEGRTLEFPAHVGDVLEFVLRTDEPFRPSDLPGSLDDDGRLALVARLVREGLLVSC